ncbi:MAG: SCP2 sterol-binding domain-containing protein [Eubacterium sp.]|nr:SCP2 sterol-binding domain-containing protein [Eubacterium sp.]
MRVNIYYGGRGLIDDPTLFALEKIEKVLEELRVTVERYNLYEEKSNIMVLPKTLKDVDGVILAASVEWFGYGGFLQQFLDACWLYGDKDKMSKLYMMPVVMATTYGEREASYNLIRAWEMLGGLPEEGLCAYVDDHVEFETNAEYGRLIEKKAENFYRTISKKAIALPNSSMQVKKKVSRGSTLSLTPQESEQLSAYVSNDSYVKKQKEDIEELASLFKGMLGVEEAKDPYVTALEDHFYPMDDAQVVFRIDLIDEDSTLVAEINKKKLNCYRGETDRADVIAKVHTPVFESIIKGEKSFQAAFMDGAMTVQGNLKIVRSFDMMFRFD